MIIEIISVNKIKFILDIINEKHSLSVIYKIYFE